MGEDGGAVTGCVDDGAFISGPGKFGIGGIQSTTSLR